jgi:hypothetical protein
VSRLEWALEHARSQLNKPNPADWPALEEVILDLAVRDADARFNVTTLGEAAAVSLEKAAAGGPDAPAALSEARATLEKALYEVDYRMVTSYRRDQLHNGVAAAQLATDPGRLQMLHPTNSSAVLQKTAATVRELVTAYKFEDLIRNRLRGIRTGGLPGPM